MIDLPLEKMQEIAKEKYNLNNFPNDFIENFIFNSLAFKMKDLELTDVQKVLNNEQTNLTAERVAYIKNYYKAIVHALGLLQNKEELDENKLKDIHAIIVGEDNIGGLYRNVDISIENSRYTPPAHLKVYSRMKKYFTTLEAYKDPIEKAAFSLLQLDKNHPFLNGNGRLSRLIINFYLLDSSLPPVIIPHEEKDHYFSLIEKFKVEKEIDSFNNYLLSLIESSINR